MTTYRCAACGKEVKTSFLRETQDAIDVTPCEVCIGVAEEAVKEVVKEEAHNKGYQEGWDDCDSMRDVEEEADDS